jgi:aminopeptidase N
MAHGKALQLGMLAWLVMNSGTSSAVSGPSPVAGTPLSVPGISRALATDRAARVSALHYDLHFSLRPQADTMPGREVLHFKLTPQGSSTDLYIDFREGNLTSVTLNGQSILPSLADGHLRLPAHLLRAADNTLDAVFTSRIAAAGAAITRYEDKDDGSEYIYSLFVPMDASMAFPCFDQPDLKAGFTLSVDAPSSWTVIANTIPQVSPPKDEITDTRFPETKPISTYLFAFAAGPWVSVHPTPAMPNVYVRASQVKRAEPEVPQLQEITARGMAWLADYFQQPFPFPKYDIVLIPGFPFGGMEHAGETFLREDVVLFRTAPTAADRFSRNITTLHELTHQWFGDLVTMRWFDDLWLKEGFAQYMAYRCLDSLEPDSDAWKHFYEDIKPQAYGIDETLGTTPIFQNISNLKDAKSAYGAIVYQKAPAILKQLEFTLGAEFFRDGLRLYLKQHAYANAQWSDLIEAFHTVSGHDVRTWADSWVLHRGMPQVTASWSCDAQGKLAGLTLHQQDVLPDNFLWPIATNILLHYPADIPKQAESIRFHWDTAEASVSSVIGQPCPDFIFANVGDQACGRFLLDPQSERTVRTMLTDGAPGTLTSSSETELARQRDDTFLRSMLWGALWDNVHVANSSPRSYVELALTNLLTERDETLFSVIAGHATTALHFYLTGPARTPLVTKFESIATKRMQQSDTPGLRINSFRALTGIAETPAGRDTLKQLLSGKLTVPGVELRQLDRWNLIGRLISLNDSDASAIFAAEQQRDRSGDGQKYAWSVQAGAPTSQAKQQYFAQYLLAPTDPAAKPEDWLTQSLRPFNSWNQSTLTEPYLRRALDQLPEIKRDRKIFYLGAWLSAFIGGQQSPAAAATARQWLAQPNIDPDLRLKVLEDADELERTVRIRQRFPD